MKNKMKKRALIVIVITLLLTVITPVGTYANGWVDKSHADRIYGSGGESHAPEGEEAEKMNSVEKYLVGLVVSLGDSILGFLDGGTVPLSIDGIVLGRLASNVDVAYVRFELEEGNPWGVIGAILYRTVAGAFIGFFLIVFLWHLGKFLIKSNTARERAEIKEFFFRFIGCFIAVFIGYILIDWIIFFSDILNYIIQKYISAGIGCDTGSAASIVGAFREDMVNNGGFFNTILFFASVFSGLFFITNYVGTAIVQTGLFGVFPVVALKATSNKQAFSIWTSSFVANIFIPCIDGALLLMPNAFYNVIFAAAGEDAANSISVRFIQLLIIWAIIPSRNAILRAVGGAQAAQANGLHGLGAMALMAARMLGRGAGNSLRSKVGNTGSSDKGGGMLSDIENKQEALTQSENFTEANRMTTAGLSGLDELLGESEAGPNIRFSSDISDKGDIGEPTDEAAIDGFLNEGGESLDGRPDYISEAGVMDGSENVGADYISEAGVMDGSENVGADYISEAGVMDGSENVGADYISEAGVMDGSENVGADYISEAGVNSFDTENGISGTSSLSGYQNIPNMQGEFAQTLEGADLDRYANLSARDALKDEFSSNNLRMSEINEQIASDADAVKSIHTENAHLSSINEEAQANNVALNRDISSLQSRNGDIDKEITNLRSAGAPTASSQMEALEKEKLANNTAIQSKSAAAARNTELINRNSATIASNGDRLAAIDTKHHAYHAEVAGLQTRNQKLQSGIENCNSREKQYASNYANAGMSDKSYSDARGFRIDKQAQQNVAKQLNYKNFDKGDFDKYLTPEQRAKMYRERAVKGTLINAGKTATKVAAGAALGAAGATVGATVTMFGGPGAMAAGAAVGGGASVNTARAAVKGGASVYQYGKEVGKEVIKPKFDKTVTEMKQRAASQQVHKHSQSTGTQKPAAGASKQQNVNKNSMDALGRELREDYRRDVEKLNRAYEQHKADK